MASIPPQTIVLSITLAGTIVAAGRSLLRSVQPARPAQATVGPPAAIATDRQARGQPVIPPTVSDDQDDDSNEANPVPAQAPPINVVLASFMSALGYFDSLLAFMQEPPLNVSVLVASPSGVVRRGPRGHKDLRINGMSDHALYIALTRLWAGVRRKGEYQLGRADFTIAGAIESVRSRVERVLSVIREDSQMWVGRAGIHTVFKDYPFVGREYTVSRFGVHGNKPSDTYCESAGVISDTIWVHQVFLIAKVLSMRYGANHCQSTYIGVSVAIDAVCVAYGLDPRTGVVGITAEDLGITVPTEIPQTFVPTP